MSLPVTLADSSPKPVVVWRLRRHPNQEVWCLATKVGHLFVLTVCHDTSHRAGPMRERFGDIVSILQRADQVKEDFLNMGWREPERHEHDSGAYDRLVRLQSSCSTDDGVAVTPLEEHGPQDEPPAQAAG